MKETIENIMEKIKFSKKQNFETFVSSCLHYSGDSSESTYAVHKNVVFKLDTFFKGFTSFVNEFGKNRKYEAGVHAIKTICDELAVDIDEEECFILFHLRDLGKFRMKESKLLDELKNLWRDYPEYKLDDQDFSYALKSLMRKKFIDYRKGNLHVKSSVIIRYRTNIRE